MNPIIIIDDDSDDHEIIKTTLKEMKVLNEVIFFYDGNIAFDYLSKKEVVPFLIFSDINMPLINGFQLRDRIHEDDDLRIKCIPFIFLTTGGESSSVWEAYSKSAQGYFIKPNIMKDWKILLTQIVDYWGSSKKPHDGNRYELNPLGNGMNGRKKLPQG